MTRLSAVLLAAGGSRRLGRPKQLLVWRGEPLVRHAARAALEAGVDELIAVVGAERDGVAAALEGLALQVVDNPRWSEGMGGSIAAGARAASGDALLLLTADQPGVTGDLLARLIDAMRAGHPRVACAYAGVLGVPALFADPGDLAALRALSGDRGARELLRGSAPVHAVPAEGAADDIDDETDWQRWQEKQARRWQEKEA